MTTEPDAIDLFSLRALRTLLSIADTKSLTRAAIHLGIAQSAVSRQLQELEEGFGGALFHRHGRGVGASELLVAMLPRIRALLAQAEELRDASRVAAGVLAGTVTVGLVAGVAGALTSALYGLLAPYPGIRLRVHEGYTGDLENALAQGRLDLAVLNRYRARGDKGYQRLFDAQLCCVGTKPVLLQGLSALEKQRRNDLPAKVSADLLGHLPLVLPTPPNAIRGLLDERVARQNLRLNLLVECGTSASVKRMLRDHPCATILPHHAVHDELERGELHAIPIAEREFRQYVVLATSSHLPFTQAIKTVARLIPTAAHQIHEKFAGMESPSNSSNCRG